MVGSLTALRGCHKVLTVIYQNVRRSAATVDARGRSPSLTSVWVTSELRPGLAHCSHLPLARPNGLARRPPPLGSLPLVFVCYMNSHRHQRPVDFTRGQFFPNGQGRIAMEAVRYSWSLPKPGWEATSVTARPCPVTT